MSDLITTLTLGAGFNTEPAICNYLEISRSTWYRRLRAGRLRKCETDALRARAGYILNNAKFRNYRCKEDRIYSPGAGFVTACEIDNMDLIRQFLAWAHRENPDATLGQIELL